MWTTNVSTTLIKIGRIGIQNKEGIMKKEEAIDIIKAKYPDKEIGKVTENDDYFIINILPKNSSAGESIITLVSYDDGLRAVHKETGNVFTYNPIKHG